MILHTLRILGILRMCNRGNHTVVDNRGVMIILRRSLLRIRLMNIRLLRPWLSVVFLLSVAFAN